jgi:hypothetical protein
VQLPHTNLLVKPQLCSVLLVLQEIRSFEGFNSPWYKQLLFVLLGICTFGLLFLVAKWSLRVRTALRLSRCPLKQAKFVRVTVRGLWFATLCCDDTGSLSHQGACCTLCRQQLCDGQAIMAGLQHRTELTN